MMSATPRLVVFCIFGKCIHSALQAADHCMVSIAACSYRSNIQSQLHALVNAIDLYINLDSLHTRACEEGHSGVGHMP